MPRGTSEQETKRGDILQTANRDDFLGLGLMVSHCLQAKPTQASSRISWDLSYFFLGFCCLKKSLSGKHSFVPPLSAMHQADPTWQWVMDQTQDQSQPLDDSNVSCSLFLTIPCTNCGAAPAPRVSAWLQLFVPLQFAWEAETLNFKTLSKVQIWG